MKATLYIYAPESQINRVIQEQEELTIGRSPMCSLPLKDRKLSRIHCKVYYEQDNFYILDQQSTNGTFLNNVRINTPRRLKNDDVLLLGDTKIEVKMNVAQIPAREQEKELPLFFDGYELIKEVGSGGLGVVYKAKKEATNEIVAIKVLKRTAASDPMMVRRFLKEARVCASLNHPVLLKVYDLGMVEERPYLVSEFVPGKTLSSIIHRQKKLDIKTALTITSDIAEALTYSHNLGFIHRDIKPSNMLVVLEPLQVKLIDMGMVKFLNESGFTIMGDTLGTPRYMPPEQIEDASSVNHLADIYSLGATLYHMLAGVPPYNNVRIKRLCELLDHFVTYPPEPIENLVDLPKDVIALVNKAMNRNPKARFQDTKSFQNEIKKIFRGKNFTNIS
ncbi:MAG: protein kinase [Planctomycetes bacterium]|jgi:serine/threonine protein kinase|nr:protein kinase [Planctomycetota bacterium]HPY74050.1 FHA domain-containing serine/threonine-protein kinase [Planctomycetota bacterium]